jgi:hypothetical protein
VRRALCGLALAIASFYSPQLHDCEISCSTGACPAGFSCEAGVCRVGGFTGSCGAGSDAAPRDGAADTSVVDVPPDTLCSHTCYASAAQGLSAIGTTGCVASNGCSAAAYPWLESIDLCPCSTSSFPILYVRRSGSTADVVYVGEPFAGQTYQLQVNDVGCSPAGSSVCGPNAVSDCGQNAGVFVWSGVTITPGIANSFELFLDTTTNCTTNAFASFAIVP